ncbi:hypothetical protein GGS24DRAFT_458168 [Hypoxylon argillaceum]|nr:hypothetical protein GGS24DRAFT_458168 [Hypoxylon argillaceum]KAI1154241.1 hypothetical protein F4825DRAFT_412552 [Nemania diffusa]
MQCTYSKYSQARCDFILLLVGASLCQGDNSNLVDGLVVLTACQLGRINVTLGGGSYGSTPLTRNSFSHALPRQESVVSVPGPLTITNLAYNVY